MLRLPSGAGVGGVATAARLANAGFKVTVLEKNSFTGGRCSLIHHEGYVGQLNQRGNTTSNGTLSASIKAPLSSYYPRCSGKYSTIWIRLLKLKV